MLAPLKSLLTTNSRDRHQCTSSSLFDTQHQHTLSSSSTTQSHHCRGDTILEVTIAITVFCIVSVGAIGIMDRDLNTIQGSLELEMARNEIDSQAEALRFIHNSFLSEREYVNKEYKAIWSRLSQSATTPSEDPSVKNLVNSPEEISPFTASQCSVYYDEDAETKGEPHNIYIDNAFVINTRDLDPTRPNQTIISARESKDKFINTSLYPRIVYTSTTADTTNTDTSMTEVEALSSPYNQVATIEGLWVIASRDATSSSSANLSNTTPEFFDYHIRTCWYAPNRNYPTTIATIIRLYNPEVIKEAK